MRKLASIVVLASAAFALMGCDVIVEPDGPRREDFVRPQSDVHAPTDDGATPSTTLSDIDGVDPLAAVDIAERPLGELDLALDRAAALDPELATGAR